MASWSRSTVAKQMRVEAERRRGLRAGDGASPTLRGFSVAAVSPEAAATGPRLRRGSVYSDSLPKVGEGGEGRPPGKRRSGLTDWERAAEDIDRAE